MLEEKVDAVKATEDPEVMQALQQLVEQMKTHGIGGETVAQIQFNISGGVMQGVAERRQRANRLDELRRAAKNLTDGLRSR